jgi:hypothetical protein
LNTEGQGSAGTGFVRGAAIAYIICEPAPHYFHVMTGATRMPVFIGQRI